MPTPPPPPLCAQCWTRKGKPAYPCCGAGCTTTICRPSSALAALCKPRPGAAGEGAAGPKVEAMCRGRKSCTVQPTSGGSSGGGKLLLGDACPGAGLTLRGAAV